MNKIFSSRRALPIFLSLMLAICLLVVSVAPANAYYGVPLISIVSVDKDESVTISGSGFPGGRDFTVRMGPFGTLAIGGTVVGTYDSSLGSSFTQTFAIPSDLVGSDRIAIRLDSYDGYYSFNWFVNDPDAAPTAAPYNPPAPPPGYHGYPTFDIVDVDPGESVTVKTHNIPDGQSFTVRMGDYGTYGVGGTVVGETSDEGGSFTETYDIPDWLADKSAIAIRMDGPTGYFAYNWFPNKHGSSPTSVPPSEPGAGPIPGYYGYPTIYIASVVRDSTVTIKGYNFPSDQAFTVRMGPYGTLGIGGYEVATVDTDSGGSFTATYDIPSDLEGSPKIAIRLENGYYYAFNWFYNTTAY